MVGTCEGLVVPVLQSVALGEEEVLVLCDCVTLTVALLHAVIELGAVVATGLGLPVIEVLGVALPETVTVALAHKVEEAQPVTDDETLGEMEADSVRLIVPVGVDA